LTRRGQRKTHHEDGQFNLVAWGGIEPPTQGFSIRDPDWRGRPNLNDQSGVSKLAASTSA